MLSGKKESSKRQLSDNEDEPVSKRPNNVVKNSDDCELQSPTCDANIPSTSWLDDLSVTSEDDEASSLPLEGFDIDDKLEEKLKKHGLSRRNAKTIIHELLSDEHVRGLLKANLNKENLKTLPEAKTLRSKQKKSSSDKLKFTELPLPEDDEEDDEYHPDLNFDLDNTFDTEASQDTQATTDSIFAAEKTGLNDSFMSKLKQCDSEIQAIQAHSEKEIVAFRTRSKHSLLDIAMAEIETAFKPPDVTEDMYKPSGDDDWHKWLAELMFDDQILKEPEVVDNEDDCEQDPDYDFLQSDTEEVNDVDDFRGGHATHITKKEVQELLQERHIPTVTFQGELQPPNPSKTKLTKPKFVPSGTSLLLENSSLTVQEHLSLRRKKLLQLQTDTTPQMSTNVPHQVASVTTPLVSELGEKFHSPEMNRTVKKLPSNDLHFTTSQLDTMKTQLRQHVQLLTQLNLLSRNSSSLSTIVHETHALLKELQQLDEHDRRSFNLQSSFFNVPFLDQALDIVQLNITKSGGIIRLPRLARNRGLLPMQRNIGVIIATNPLFAFAPLLPPYAPPSSSRELSRLSFTPSEDNLLVLGVAQMQNYTLPWYTLVYQYMMPCKLPDQLRARYSNSSIRNEAGNPIRVFKRTRQLPDPPSLCSSSIGPGTDVDHLLYLTKCVLPDWLLALQRELEDFSTQITDNNLQISINPSNPNRPSQQKADPQNSSIPISLPTVIATQSTTTIAIVSPMKSISILMPGVISAQVHPLIQPRLAPSSGLSAKKRLSPPSRKSKSIARSVKLAKKKKSGNDIAKEKMKNERDKVEAPSVDEDATPSVPRVESNQLHGVVAKNGDEIGTSVVTIAGEHHTSIFEPPSISPVKSPMLAESMDVDSPRDHVSTNETVPSVSTSSQKLATSTNEEKIQSKNLPSTSKEESNPGDEEEDLEDEAVTTEDDFDEETDFHLNEGADEMSEEEVISSKKRVEKKKKKEFKVKWKSQNRANTKQLGGRLHRLHPGLTGKRKSKASEDDLSKSLRESAQRVKLLEEETIVQLDPLRGEKEILFAQGYLKRVEETLAYSPEVFIKVLETLVEFEGDFSQAPTALFNKLSKHLEPWPELLQGFAPFLLPEQAHKCGLLSEQQVYARARKFLRQLEIRFHDSPQQLTRILNTFKSIAETGIYKEKEVKNTILSLLKCDPYLQEEFLMFFDDERPPESRLHGDYEQVTWNDDLLKETHNTEFEHISISAMGHHNEHIANNEASTDTIRSPARQHSSRSSKEVITPVDASEVKKDDVAKEQRSTPTVWDELPPTDTEEDTGESSSHKDVLHSCLPDLALISEDALSCSPFKRHHPNSSSCARPSTPTAVPSIPLDESELSLSSHLPSSNTSTSLGSLLPITPTASKSSVDEDVIRSWTFDDDKILLNSCKEYGPTKEAFNKVSISLNRSDQDVQIRFKHLMSLLIGGDAADTDTTSHYTTDSESEVSVEE